MKAKLLETCSTNSTTWTVPLADVLSAFIEPHELEVKGTWWITSGSDEGTAAITRQVTVTSRADNEAEPTGRDLVSQDDVKALINEALTERGIVK